MNEIRPSLFIRMLDRLATVRWGGQALVSLYISVLSGVVIALQFSAAEPFHSTVTMELVAPFGSFWRGLHYYSSQAFFLLLFVHLAAIIYRNDHDYKRGHWVRLALSIPAALLLLFTGYVLRADATGEAAGNIAEHIMLAIPLFGELLNKLLFDLQASGMKRVYAHHLIGLMVFGGWCVWPHLRRYTARWRDHFLVLILLLVISVAWAVPLEVEHFGMLHINGPWFFLGLQELLRYIPPFWAGVAFPGLILAALLFIPHSGRYRQPVLFGIGLWLLFYAVLTGIGYSRGLS